MLVKNIGAKWVFKQVTSVTTNLLPRWHTYCESEAHAAQILSGFKDPFMIILLGDVPCNLYNLKQLLGRMLLSCNLCNKYHLILENVPEISASHSSTHKKLIQVIILYPGSQWRSWSPATPENLCGPGILDSPLRQGPQPSLPWSRQRLGPILTWHLVWHSPRVAPPELGGWKTNG